VDPIARKAKNYRDRADKSPFRAWIKRKLDVNCATESIPGLGVFRSSATMGTASQSRRGIRTEIRHGPVTECISESTKTRSYYLGRRQRTKVQISESEGVLGDYNA